MKLALWCLALPLALTILVWISSPNYRFAEAAANPGQPRDPLGGDFLQEYVGGKIFDSGEQERLYDLDWIKQVQHDSNAVGFTLDPGQYYPMVYPPFYYAILSPLSRLNYQTATIIWTLLSSLALSWAGFVLIRFGQRIALPSLFAFALFFSPLVLCVNMGQKSTLLLAILSTTFVLLQHRKALPAGLVFGLIAFKPHLGIVIGLAMLWKRQWHFVAGALTTVAVLVGGSYLHSPQLWTGYFETALSMRDYLQTAGYDLAESHSVNGALKLSLGSFAPSLVTPLSIAAAIGIIAVVGWSLRGPLETSSPQFTRQFSLFIIAMILLGPHLYTYDLAMLLLPMYLAFASFGTMPTDRPVLWAWGIFFIAANWLVPFAAATGIQISMILLIAIGGLILTRPRRS